MPLGVVDLAHLVHVHERVEGGQVDPGEGAAYREPLTLEPDGAVVTDTTGRSTAVSTVGMRGRATVSALVAGMPAPWGSRFSSSKDTCIRNIPHERSPPPSSVRNCPGRA